MFHEWLAQNADKTKFVKINYTYAKTTEYFLHVTKSTSLKPLLGTYVLGAQGDARTGPRPIRARLSMTKTWPVDKVIYSEVKLVPYSEVTALDSPV